jgi:hypothetical protein
MTPSAFTVNGFSASIKYVPLKKLFTTSASGHVGYGETPGAAIAHLVKLAIKDSTR